MAASSCVFCKIVSGAIPALKIYETDDCLAFLDIGPLSSGHTLLIPKKHYQSILDAPPELVAAMARELPRISRAVLNATGATGLNILQNTGESSGQAVFHLHMHLIPRRSDDGLGYRWNAGAYPSGEAERLQARLVDALAR